MPAISRWFTTSIPRRTEEDSIGIMECNVKCARLRMPTAAPISVSQASAISPTSSTQVKGTESQSM